MWCQEPQERPQLTFFFLLFLSKHTQYIESGIMNPQHPFGLDGFTYDHFTSVHSTTENKWIASSFGLLWTKSLWPSLYMAYEGHKHSFPQAAYRGMKLLGHGVGAHLALVFPSGRSHSQLWLENFGGSTAIGVLSVLSRLPLWRGVMSHYWACNFQLFYIQ